MLIIMKIWVSKSASQDLQLDIAIINSLFRYDQLFQSKMNDDERVVVDAAGSPKINKKAKRDRTSSPTALAFLLSSSQ